MENIYIRDDFIKLGQALKLSGIAQSGIDAKMMVLDGLVKVNGETQLQRGKKLYEDDTFEAEGKAYRIKRKEQVEK